jgi:hypothetical protein
LLCNGAVNTPLKIIVRLCFLRGPCKVVIKKSSVEKSRDEFRDASLPGYELEIELRESVVAE